MVRILRQLVLGEGGDEGQGKRLGKDWLSWGRQVDLPVYGSLAVVYFEDNDAYHVGFVDGIKGKYVLLLGGNQSHGLKVSISSFEKASIKGFRLPKEYSGPERPASERTGEYGSDNAAGTR